VSAPAPPGGPSCPRCGAPHGENQEYCLECGYRLQPRSGILGTLSSAWHTRFGRYPSEWVWPVAMFFVIAVAGAGAAIVLADAGAEDHTIVATEGGPPHSPTTSPVTSTVALPTVPTGTPTGPPSTPTNPPPATTTAPRPGALTSWPAGKSGFTIILESIPTRGGRSLAIARARDASRSGLPQVGVLESGRYSSLHPGYYVVFSGIYSSRPEAERARAAVSAKGFRTAYTKEITR
jgi:hypothetical protein